jgi:hypothetical protein
METILARRCETCCHHRLAETSILGSCGHPERQPPPGHVIPFVRNRELGCYGGWGIDQWLDCSDEHHQTADGIPLGRPPDWFPGVDDFGLPDELSPRRLRRPDVDDFRGWRPGPDDEAN